MILTVLALAAPVAASTSTAEVRRVLQEQGYAPKCTGTTDWMLVLYILGPLYAAVMSFVAWTLLVRDRRGQQPVEITSVSLEAGFGASSSAEGESSGKPFFRKVDRGRSAWGAARSGRAGGAGFSMEAINKQVRMGFLRKVYAILSTQVRQPNY